MKRFGWIALLFVLVSRTGGAWTLIGAGLAGWETRDLTIYVSSANCTVEEAALLSVIDAALASWNGVSTTNITLRRATLTEDEGVTSFLAGTSTQVPVILCDPAFGSSNGVDSDFVPAATRLSTLNARINYAGILLNAEAGKSAEISQLSETELLITIAHELGHMLGLGHSKSKEALMYYSISNKTKAVLTVDDTDGLTYLYPRNELTKGAFGCAAVHRSQSLLSDGWLWALLVVLVNLLLGRVVSRRSRGREIHS